MLHFFAFFLLGLFCTTTGFPQSDSKSNTSTTTKATVGTTKKAPEQLPNSSNSTTVPVTIYVLNIESFLGVPYTLDVGGCVAVPKLLFKKTSSIDTHGNCMLLYGRQDCTGQEVRIPANGETFVSLETLKFDDTLASLQPCESKSNKEKPKLVVAAASTTGAKVDKPQVNTTKEQPKSNKPEDADKRHKRSEPTHLESVPRTPGPAPVNSESKSNLKDSKVDEPKGPLPEITETGSKLEITEPGLDPVLLDMSAFSDFDKANKSKNITLIHVIY